MKPHTVKPQKTEEEVRRLVEEADEIRGLGDVVARVTKRLGIPECQKCSERRRKLNRIFPIKPRPR